MSWGKKGVSSTVRPWMGEGLLRCPLRSPSHLFSFSRDFRRASFQGSLLREQTAGSSLPGLFCQACPTSYPATLIQSPESCENGGSSAWREGESKGQQAQPTSLKASFDRGGGTSGLGFQFNSTMIYCGPASCRGSGLG